MRNLSQTNIINEVLENVREDMENEEIIHLVLENQVSQDAHENNVTMGQRTADKIARLVGSWGFIIIFSVLIIIWMIFNSLMGDPFDPYPFILLNLFLSCVAAIQAPIIMMSQNRQEQKDRLHAENDYKVNLKTEIIIQDLHNKLDQIIENQTKILNTNKDI